MLINTSSSVATAASAYGTVIVGTSGGRAFRWASGFMNDLGALPGATQTAATGVSADGRTVTGWSGTGTNRHAFVWTATSGMKDLGIPVGGTYSMA